MRVSIGMTLHTVVEHQDTSLDMRFPIFVGIVRMAVVARVSLVGLRVARRACDLALAAVIDRESVLCQSGRRPTLNRVACGAVSPE